MAEAKKVYRKNRNGVTYIYLDEPYWDREKKVGSHRTKCIGKLNVAENENRTRSELIREALRTYINRNKIRNNSLAKQNAQLLDTLLD